MERLTGRTKAGLAYYKKCFEEPCKGMAESDCALCDYQNVTVCERLAAYEDLGVSPEQLHEVSKLYLEKCEEINRLRAELEEYKSAEEKGLLLRLPCKIKDTVYAIVKNKIVKDVVEDYDIWSLRNGLHLRIKLRTHRNYVIGLFGKDIFLTKEEAEQVLKQMGGIKV